VQAASKDDFGFKNLVFILLSFETPNLEFVHGSRLLAIPIEMAADPGCVERLLRE
jgi:hypothetical protein